MAKRKKIVIIGGGVSGLTAGIYARKAGFNVEIYEKNQVPGGECTGWDRDGYHIDNCILWLVGTRKDTELYNIWKTVGMIDSARGVHSFDKMYASELAGQRLTLWADVDRTEREMIALSPEDEFQIKRLMDLCRDAVAVEIPAEKPPELMTPMDGIKLGFKMKKTVNLLKEFYMTDTQDLMELYKHPLIRCLISDFCPPQSGGSSFPMAYGNFLSGDGGVPAGGSRAAALRMKDKFEALGGKFFAASPAAKIELKDGRAAAVILEDGSRVEADYVVPACDASFTFKTLLGEEYTSPVFEEMYRERELYPVFGMFQAAFAVDCERDLTDGELMLDASKIVSQPWQKDRITVKSYSYEPSFAPSGKQLLQILWPLAESGYDFWRELYKDEEAYRSYKEELAGAARGLLEERFPEYAGKLSLLDTWTPMTYERYCNAYKGYNQAFIVTKHADPRKTPSPYIDGIENVVLAGQWLAPPGGLPGAAIQGKYAVQRILKKEGRDISI